MKKYLMIAAGALTTALPFSAFADVSTYLLDPYLRAALGFLGITGITFIRAEGVAMGLEARSVALASAKKETAALAA